ncbi:hypothetical protein C8N35_101513 [Breoghania corrubedonensis]|uniref:Uncharacterized protein n=1 Tax=Breoghania corrubedonensis TaxID=665038 RepID=A0A2T5VFE9_9HYPH|nr:hypothetical protein C8N35_101513 [Breoghania corrubedonensis]
MISRRFLPVALGTIGRHVVKADVSAMLIPSANIYHSKRRLTQGDLPHGSGARAHGSLGSGCRAGYLEASRIGPKQT